MLIIIVFLVLFDCAAASTHKHDRLRDAEVSISSWSGCTITGTIDDAPVTLFMDVASCPLHAKVPGKVRVRFDETCGAVLEMTDGPRIETPMPPSCPTPSPTPPAQPTPEPTPVPTPARCTMTAPTLVVIPRNGSGTVSITLTDISGPTQVSAVSSTPGQVSVSPSSQTPTGTSAIVAFSVRTKKQPAQLTFTSPCGTRVISVTVR